MAEEYQNKFRNITSGATTVIKAASGVLLRIIVNTTAAGTIGIFDNPSTNSNPIGTLKASVVEGSYEFGCAFITGLTIVTGAASDITVVYR